MGDIQNYGGVSLSIVGMVVYSGVTSLSSMGVVRSLCTFTDEQYVLEGGDTLITLICCAQRHINRTNPFITDLTVH